ncbi:MAG: hypothetical protein AB1938_24690 [Myxococcota bacterium]
MNQPERTARHTRLAVAVVVVAVLLGGVWLAYHRLVRDRWAVPLARQEARLAAGVETFCAAEAELAKRPEFVPGPRTKDAAPWLSPLVGFESPVTDGGVTLPAGTLRSPQAVKDALKKAAPDFLDALSDEELASIDTSSLARAHDFDHWELTGPSGAWQAASPLTAADAPYPRFLELISLSKVHLAKASRAGTLAEAAKDVRQVAKLCLSTETLLGAMVGLALLGVEERAHAWALAHAVEAPGWAPVDAATVGRARAVLRLSPAFFGPMANEATFARALSCARVSRCVGLTETASFMRECRTCCPSRSAHASGPFSGW